MAAIPMIHTINKPTIPTILWLSGQSNSPACIQCTNDPTNPLCKGIMDNKMAEGQGGFGTPEAGASPNDFNVGI